MCISFEMTYVLIYLFKECLQPFVVTFHKIANVVQQQVIVVHNLFHLVE